MVDTYLSEMASKDGLTVDVFTKMVEAVPRDHRTSHDTIFRTMEKLLKSGADTCFINSMVVHF